MGLEVHTYRIAGLAVGSECVLPGVVALPPPDHACDVTIRQQGVPLALDEASARDPHCQIAGGKILLRVPEIARFLLTEGRDVAFEAEGDTTSEEIAPFLTGTVFGALLHQRGHIALHASAVRVNGKGVLFCGPSGSGKSTLAAALGKRGYALVADDLCAITPGATPQVQSDGRQLRLWTQAIDGLDLGARRGASVHRRIDKRFVDPDEVSREPLPVGPVYLLQDAAQEPAVSIDRVEATEAVQLTMETAYRPFIVGRLGQQATYFRAAAAIAHVSGVFRLARPLDFALLADTIARLECHWREIGLIARVAA
jgi:hypothetical protein